MFFSIFSILFKTGLYSPPKLKSATILSLSSLHASLLIYRCHSGLATEDLSVLQVVASTTNQACWIMGRISSNSFTIKQSAHLFTCGMLDDFGHALLGLHKFDVKNPHRKGWTKIGDLTTNWHKVPSLTSVQLEFSCA